MAQTEILLIEDNPGDAGIIEELLRHTRYPSRLTFNFNITHVERLGQGLDALKQQPFNLILLDLGLPDSGGINALEQIYGQASNIPIIVLTGTSDDELALKTVRAGAQDYLIKEHLTGPLLTRAIRYALERHQLQMELIQTGYNHFQKRELDLLSELTQSSQTAITAEMFGLTRLQIVLPDTFAQIVTRYEELLELAIEQQIHKGHNNLSFNLQRLAEDLGLVRSGPRDIIEIHKQALLNKSKNVHPRRAQAYLEEGRLLLLELMGHLVSFYRNLSLGTRYVANKTSTTE